MIKTIETSTTWHGGFLTRVMYNELQQGMIKSAEEIAERARQLVPVGPGVPKHLRDTIRAVGKRKQFSTLGEQLAHGIARGDFETALPGAFVFAGERKEGVYWVHWVEYGTHKQAAQPFLRPAADGSFNAVLAEAEHAAQRAINTLRRERDAKSRAEAKG